MGFVGGFIREEYGGLGLGFTEVDMIIEQFWRVDPGIGNMILTAFGAEIIQDFGTEEQKKKFLPPIPSGDKICCCAITEADAGSDILQGTTTAVRDGSEYVINGNKMFITNGTVADLAVVFCVTHPKGGRYERHSFIVVDSKTPGFEAVKIHGKMGIRASDTAELIFKDVRVPAENLIGNVES